MNDETWYERYTVGAVSTNCYLLSGSYLIDPGGVTESLRADLEHHEETIEAILLTHAHYDHIAGIPAVREQIGDCPIICHSADAPMLADPEKNMSLWSGETVSFEPDLTYEEAGDLTVGGETVDVLETPGHTPGGVSLYLADAGLVLVGDTLFRQGIGRSDLPGGDHQQLLSSIRSELLSLPRGTTVLPGHGEETTIGTEAHDNPYLD